MIKLRHMFLIMFLHNDEITPTTEFYGLIYYLAHFFATTHDQIGMRSQRRESSTSTCRRRACELDVNGHDNRNTNLSYREP